MYSTDAVPHLGSRGLAPSINTLAVRTQRPRKQGYRSPPGTRYAGRPTILANPFDGARFGHAKSVLLYRRWLAGELGAHSLERIGFCPAEIDALTRLRGRVLGLIPHLRGMKIECWCPMTSRWCHVDLLVTLINGGRI